MHDIIIIGGGPAGLVAALYARRANKSVLVIEKGSFGGQITFKHISVLNFNSCDVFTVDCVNMRRIMLALLKVHSYYYSVKS